MKEKTRKKLKKIPFIILMLGLGFAMGFLFVYLLDMALGENITFPMILLMLLLFFIAYFLNVILHEAGHLIMGLATGYRFLSFRVLSLIMIRNTDGKMEFKKFSIPGTLGQCLLTPPDLDENGMMPVTLYNLGGIMMNFTIFLFSLIAFLLIPNDGILKAFIAVLGLCGLLMGLENGIPLGCFGLNNDGENIRQLRKNPRVVKSLWKQLKINADQTEGKLFSEMDPELFEIPTVEEMKDNLISAEAVFKENYLMEKMDHEETLEYLDWLLDTKDINLIDIYRAILEADRTLIKLLLGKEVTVSKNDRKMMKQFSVMTNVLVTRYAVAKLLDRNEKDAVKIRKQYEAAIRTTPYRSDAVTLPKYMNEIDKKALEA